MIDTSKWKEFKVSEVFITKKDGKVPTGASMAKKDLKEGNIPRVTVIGKDNGIIGYFADSDNKNYRTYENFISVSFLGTIFYQPKKTSLDMKVHCLKPLNYELNEYSAGYIISIIRKAISNFAFLDQLSSTVLTDLTFSLPATSNGYPDWAYMESYMKSVMKESEKSLENLKKANSSKHIINVNGWKAFAITDLFELYLPEGDIQEKKAYNGNFPLITSGKTNNGICKYIDKDSKSNIIQANTITVDMFGKAFYHDYQYYCVSHGRVNILIPKFNINRYVGLYIASVVEKVITSKYEFLNMCSKGALMKESIKLPVDEKGEPDWKYMENYITAIENNNKIKLNFLQTI